MRKKVIMLIAKITEIVSISPISTVFPVNANVQVMLNANRKMAVQCKSGNIVLNIHIVSGNIEEIDSCFTLSDIPVEAKCLSLKSRFLGGYEIELHFEQAFMEGLNYFAEEYLSKEHAILGLSALERQSLDKIAMQKELLNALLDCMMPERSEQIKQLARPCLWLELGTEDNGSQSYFVGQPQIEAGSAYPLSIDQQPLFHICTLHKSDFAEIFAYYGIDLKNEYLSFYMDIENTEKGWPAGIGKFKVLNYDEPTTAAYQNKQQCQEPAHPIVFIPTLNLPEYDHPILESLHLSDDEQEQYEIIEPMFRGIIGVDKDGEVNKLLGYADYIQNPVEWDAERIKNNLSYDDDIRNKANEWQLLLQISPYCHAFKFFDELGDAAIYFMIRRSDWANGNYSNIQIVAQST